MTKILTGIAALMIVGAAALPVPAGAVEQGITKAQSTELGSQRRHWRHYRHYGHRYGGPRRHYGYGYRHWGARPYAYSGAPYRYRYAYPYRYRYGYPYGYGYHRPGLAFGLGPLGFRVF